MHDMDAAGAAARSTEPPALTPGDSASEALSFIAAHDPERVLLEEDDALLTYAEADARVDVLAARLLLHEGDGPGMVGLRIEGTLELLLASLAVLRAGLTAVPLDPSAPVEWVGRCLEDVGARQLLTDTPVPRAELGAVAVHRPSSLAAGEAGSEVPPWRTGQPLAAITFTSGSTGEPKGIMVPRAMRPTVRSQLVESMGRPEQRLRAGLLSMGTAGTTESTLQAFITLGSTIVPYQVRTRGPAGLAEWLRERRVAGFTTVPTVLRQLLATLDDDDRFPELLTVVLSGETATWEDVGALRRHLPEAATVVNMFGLTETSAFAMMPIGASTEPGTGPLPIGYALPDKDVRVVGPDGEEVGPGEVGELVVEAATVALGYWRRPDESARVFAELPDGRRRVRTGDRGLRRPDGVLEHAGRADDQVKVGAVRIELGQVEAALRELTGVVAAAARTYVDPRGRTRLAGYVVVRGETAVSSAGARAALARSLPSTMLPTVVLALDALPQLAGGKLDRAALPEPGVARPSEGGPPRGGMQELLARLVADALSLPHVGADDDFFALGGDSFAAVEVLAGVEEALGVDLPPSSLVEAPTVAQLATLLELSAGRWPTVVPVRPDGDLPPLVALHAIGGEVFFARAIAEHLRPERPVYGLRADLRFAERSLPELAERYVRELRASRPEGPYVLYGLSFGAYAGLEVARTLIAQGAEVQRLVVGDIDAPGRPHVPWRERSRQQLAIDSRAAVGRWRRRVLRQPPADLGIPLFYDPADVVAAQALLANGDDVPREQRLAAAIAHHGALARDYVPRSPVPVPVTVLIAADDGLHYRRRAVAAGWSRVVDGEVTTVVVPGKHDDLDRVASGAHVARAIEAALAGS